MALKPIVVKLLGGAQLDLDANSNFASFECLFLSVSANKTYALCCILAGVRTTEVDRRVKFFMFKCW